MPEAPDNLTTIVANGASRPILKWLAVLTVLAIAGGGTYYYLHRNGTDHSTPDFVTPLNTFSYDAAGNPLESEIGSGGIVQKYTFNSPYWLTGIISQSQNGVDLFGELLTYTEGGYQGSAYI